MDVFPPDHLLQEITKTDTPVFIDIGGGIGTDVMEFRRRYPHIRGRIVLQELAAVIESAKEKNEQLFSQVISMRRTS